MSSTTTDQLLEVGKTALNAAMDAGASECEVYASQSSESRVDLRNGDVEGAATSEETTWGIRVVLDGALGFATVNRPSDIVEVAREAVRLARISPPDPLNGLRGKPAQPYANLSGLYDPAMDTLGIDGLVDLAARMTERIKKGDSRVRIDSGDVTLHTGSTALINSHGVIAEEVGAAAGGSFFGMAVDGDEVGSFDYDGQYVTRLSDFASELAAAADRFVIKTTSALGATSGKSFRGTIVLSPEVVSSFVLDNLAAGLTGRAVRTDSTPFKDNLAQRIAIEGFDLIDDPHRQGAVSSTAFDREGTPTTRRTLVEDGVLQAFLYDVYEARAANAEPTGHARGGASAPPALGPHALMLSPGSETFASLCGGDGPVLVVSRFSGNCNAVTGEFSGVVKGGFLIEKGERRAVNETLIAGNLLDLLTRISGISSDTRTLYGARIVPGMRVEDISVTAG